MVRILFRIGFGDDSREKNRGEGFLAFIAILFSTAFIDNFLCCMTIDSISTALSTFYFVTL